MVRSAPKKSRYFVVENEEINLGFLISDGAFEREIRIFPPNNEHLLVRNQVKYFNNVRGSSGQENDA